MRLGARPTTISKLLPSGVASLAGDVYGLPAGENDGEVMERHRHRYEVNPDYVSAIESKGLMFTGRDDKKERMVNFLVFFLPFFLCTRLHLFTS
jgi:CTP synthase